MNKISVAAACLTVFLSMGIQGQTDQKGKAARRIDGYKGIWFDLGQRSEYGSKYSGGLGTYTAKHCPLAVYAASVKKTFFVYGGTTTRKRRHLLAMVSYYDHNKKRVPKPVVVHDKKGVDDPHDNPSISIDNKGYIWIFVSGRARRRPGFIYRSLKPYDIDSFEQISKGEFTYGQPWWCEDLGFLHLFTRYTRGRELYWSTSGTDGRTWTAPRKLAGMRGHYQISNEKEGKIITAFNMHPGGKPDKRTNLYFVQTDDQGKTWRTVDNTPIKTPLIKSKCSTLVRDYKSERRLVYMKDIGFDAGGRPVILYLTSAGHKPGPSGDPRVWTIAHWSGTKWAFHEVTRSTHNYDMGSLYIETDGTWRIIGPTEPGPQQHGTGGEMAMWTSTDKGQSWQKVRNLTHASERNHGYARRPVNAHPGFYAFWADGNPDTMSESHLYFVNRSGTRVWCLPYTMETEYAQPLAFSSEEKQPAEKEK